MSFHGAVLDRYHATPTWAQDTLHAALVVLIGYIVLRLFDTRLRERLKSMPRADPTVVVFVIKVIDSVAWVVIAIIVLSVYGVDPTVLLGGMAVAGFVIGFALKDALGNLAAGVMLLVYRPFRVAEWVTIGGASGEIDNLGMALTTLKAADGRIITLPNGKVLGDTITNHTREPIRRADVLVGIAYHDDIGAATKAILEALRGDDRVLAEPEPGVRITELGDSSIELQVRPWVKTDDYWVAQADFHRVVKQAVEGAGCTIPFPQRDVHLYKSE